MPNKAKPRALKALQGTLRKDRDAGEVPFAEPESTDPPDWLINTDAVWLWNKLIVDLRVVLKETDLTALGHFCNQHGAIVSTIRQHGRPTAADYTQLRLMAESFGMTPSSRAKIGIGEGKPKGNAFEALEQAG